MATEEVKKYIEKRYYRFLDYAQYHCSCAGIGNDAYDVLNEVLCDVLQKPDELLAKLFNKKSGQYREIDYYILRMIKLNATSDTSPYRHKYKPIPVDRNVEWQNIEIEDTDYNEIDRPNEILEKTNIIRKTLDDLYVSDMARDVFKWRFFLGEKFKDWPGPETEKELFDIYYKVVSEIKSKINNNTLF